MSPGEIRTEPVHPGIFHVRVPPIAIARLPMFEADGPDLIDRSAEACTADLPTSAASSPAARIDPST